VRFERVFPATLDTIGEIAGALEEILESAGMPGMDAARTQLAVEEAVTNMITHGYPEGPGDLTIICETEPGMIRIIVADSGMLFDPTSIPPADVTADLDHRSIGGLGVYLIKSVMDEVSYARVGEENRLTMTKRFG